MRVLRGLKHFISIEQLQIENSEDHLDYLIIVGKIRFPRTRVIYIIIVF